MRDAARSMARSRDRKSGTSAVGMTEADRSLKVDEAMSASRMSSTRSACSAR